jgi:outer membrane immunogenic protein
MWTGLSRTFGSGNGFAPAFIPTSTTQSSVNWLASGRTRSGIALDDTLLYITGGVAFGGVNNGWGRGYAGLPTGVCCNIQNSQTKVGWVAGFGVEHMFTRNLSVRSEFLYYDLGRNDATALVVGGNLLTMAATNEVLVRRLGLSLKW